MKEELLEKIIVEHLDELKDVIEEYDVIINNDADNFFESAEYKGKILTIENLVENNDIPTVICKLLLIYIDLSNDFYNT